MLSSVAERLIQTLSVPRVAFFLAEEGERGFRLKCAFGASRRGAWPSLAAEAMDLGFLSAEPGAPYVFFEQTRHLLDMPSRSWPPAVKKTVADLDLTYYVPCSAQGRTIAYLGVSRGDKGDFLPSEDIELVVTLSGYVGIAIENSRLYTSLQRKVEENERLREFNENIVESINVGVMAVDLDDRVESWNSQMEVMYALPRAEDVPDLLVETIVTPSPNNFLGLKGVGELPTNGAPAAIANAVLDALRPLGVRHLDMPITAHKVWRALQA